MWFRLIIKKRFGKIQALFWYNKTYLEGKTMKKFISFIIRLVVLIAGITLAGFLVWQLFTDVPLLDMDVQTKGPVIVVLFSIIALISLGAGVSFFTDKNLGSTIFLGVLLAVIAIILWMQNQDLADIYRWYFIYGLIVALLSKFFRKEN